MTATVDLLTPIHKSLHSTIYDLSSRLQTNDFADLATTKALVKDLGNDFAMAQLAGCTLCVLSQHARDEETNILPDAAERGDQMGATLIEDTTTWYAAKYRSHTPLVFPTSRCLMCHRTSRDDHALPVCKH